MHMTPQAAGRRWRQLVATQEADRADHARRIQLAGWGQPLDPLLWPVIDRLWALGLSTHASCQGHPSKDTAITWIRFSNFLERDDPTAGRRWKRFYHAFHRLQGFAMVATRQDMFASYPTRARSLPFADRQARVLRRWAAIADAAGRECLQHEPPWEPWAGPAVGVPAAIDPGPSLADFLHELPWPQHLVVIQRLDGRPWAGVAQTTRLPEAECRRLWDETWAECAAYQRIAKEEKSPHDTPTASSA
jgi:hypothetical protein